MSIRVTAKALIIHEGKVLLNHGHWYHGDAYDLPTSQKRFADGGQYVRSTTATGGSAPAFETEEAWLADAAAYWGAAK